MKRKMLKLSGWGNYPRVAVGVLEPQTVESLQEVVKKAVVILPRGLGRSYGDAALAGTVLSTCRLNNLLGFDKEGGLLTCESGVSMGEILEFSIPLGWFLPVTPGTKHVTVGGAIAADVHGKTIIKKDHSVTT